MSPIADWVIDQVAAYGILPVIFVGGGLLLAAWITLGIFLEQAERRRDRRRISHGIDQLERHANDPGNRREEKP